MNADCPRIADHGCGFTCNYGYRKKQGVTEMMCQKGADDELKWNNAAPCEGTKTCLIKQILHVYKRFKMYKS